MFHHIYTHTGEYKYGVQRRKKEAKIFSKSNILHSASSFCFQLRGSQSFSAPLCSFTKWRWLTKRFTEGNASNSLTGSLHPPGAKLILNPCNNSISASINKQKQGETCRPAVHGGFFLTLIPRCFYEILDTQQPISVGSSLCPQSTWFKKEKAISAAEIRNEACSVCSATHCSSNIRFFYTDLKLSPCFTNE